MSKCLFAWLCGHWASVGYLDGIIKSLVEGMGSNTYDLENYVITFNREALGLDVDFNEDQSEIDMRGMQQEL